MKDSTKDLINVQIKKVLAELEQIEDVADRVELRIEAIEMIYKVSKDANIENVMPQGKDSIRENKAKTPFVVEEYEEDVPVGPEIEETEEYQEDIPEIPEEMVNEVEPEPEEVSLDEVLNCGADLKPEVAAQAAQATEGEEIEGLEEAEEEMQVEVPEEIMEEFEMLVNINNVSDEVVEHKIFIANWIHEDDLETVELYINYFASNIEEDENGDAMYVGEELHVDFLNENNIAGFIDYINVLSE